SGRKRRERRSVLVLKHLGFCLSDDRVDTCNGVGLLFRSKSGRSKITKSCIERLISEAYSLRELRQRVSSREVKPLVQRRESQFLVSFDLLLFCLPLILPGLSEVNSRSQTF